MAVDAAETETSGPASYFIGMMLTIAVVLAIAHILSISIFAFFEGAKFRALSIVFLMILSMIFCYFLEGTQQAANTSKSIQSDIIDDEVTNEIARDHIKQILKEREYEQLSSARQFLSIFFILALKSLIDAALPDGFTYPVNLVSYNLDIGTLINNPALTFISTALFIATALQLLPKRVARIKALSFFTRAPLFFLRSLKQIGRLGVEKPVDFLLSAREKITGEQIVGKRYGVSRTKVIEELGEKFGYIIEDVHLRFVIGEDVELHETATLKIKNSMEGIAQKGRRTSLLYSTSLSGDWTVFSSDSDVTHSNRRTYVTDIEEFLKEIPESKHAQYWDRKEEHDDEEDDEEVTRRTKIVTSLNFSGPKELPNPGDTVKFVRKIFFNEYQDEAQTPQVHTFRLGLEAPSLRLRVTIASKRDVLPSNTSLEYSNLIGEVEFTTTEFSRDHNIANDAGEKYAVSGEMYLPYYGNTIELQTYC